MWYSFMRFFAWHSTDLGELAIFANLSLLLKSQNMGKQRTWRWLIDMVVVLLAGVGEVLVRLQKNLAQTEGYS